MTVRFSCRCPNADYLGFEATLEAIIASATKAEELGFDAVFVNDHIIVDSSPRSAPTRVSRASRPSVVVIMCGLPASGKTTTNVSMPMLGES